MYILFSQIVFFFLRHDGPKNIFDFLNLSKVEHEVWKLVSILYLKYIQFLAAETALEVPSFLQNFSV